MAYTGAKIELSDAWQVASDVIDAMVVGSGDLVDRLRETCHVHFIKLLPPQGGPLEALHDVAFVEAEFRDCEEQAFMVEAGPDGPS